MQTGHAIAWPVCVGYSDLFLQGLVDGLNNFWPDASGGGHTAGDGRASQLTEQAQKLAKQLGVLQVLGGRAWVTASWLHQMGWEVYVLGAEVAALARVLGKEVCGVY